ncbi:hypothetical protein BpHYR1_021053, partial [Brachionus plicatilis]
EPVVKIKLSADGTNVGRGLKLINFCFSIINEEKKSSGLNRQYTLGIFKVDEENYDSTVSSNSNSRIVFFNHYFCSDWKISALVLGLFNASSNFPCLWCEVHKKDLADNKTSTARSFERHQKVVAKSLKIHLGYKTYPIIKDIPHSNFIIDTLHMFLRRYNREPLDPNRSGKNYSSGYKVYNSGIDLKIFKNEQKSINSIMNSLPAIFGNVLENSSIKNKIWTDFFIIFKHLRDQEDKTA